MTNNSKLTEYKPNQIEKKWQKYWRDNKTFSPDLKNTDRKAEPFYNLMMFPYPSAEGLHVGNMYAFTGADIYGRFKRMQGNEVFEPIGLDGFGIHSENYALKAGKHPREQAEISEKNFYSQLEATGNAYDWERTLETYDPKYYKWTQWIFTQMFKSGLAYRKKAKVNWCPSDMTVLADEQVIDGRCERDGAIVEKKDLEQWFFRITEYADRLLENIDRIDWPEKVKIAQKQWIGRSEGARIKFEIVIGPTAPRFSHVSGDARFTEVEKSEFLSHSSLSERKHIKPGANSESSPKLALNSPESEKPLRVIPQNIEVFTTRPDTLFGATFMVLSPEHPIASQISNLKFQISNDIVREVKKYIESAKRKSDSERTEEKEKTGVFSGLYAVNPVNNEKIPVWIADYVLMGYGTGAIMAVPAHDQRDFEFAKKYNLPIRQVIAPYTVMVGEDAPIKDDGIVYFDAATCILRHWEDPDKFYVVQFKTGQKGFPGGRIEDGESKEQAIKREILEETGYKNIKSVKFVFEHAYSRGHKARKNREEECHDAIFVIELVDGEQEKIIDGKIDGGMWFTSKEILNDSKFFIHHKFYLEHYLQNTAYVGPGILVNSGDWDDFSVPEALPKILDWLEKKGIGKRETTYHLRDWLISRQRYWGPPIPMILCSECQKAGRGEREDMPGWYTVSDKDLPVLLPDVEDWRPRSGSSPLASHPEFYNTKCPSCASPAKRETDVSDTFLDSAWYYLRYVSVDNTKMPYDIEIVKKWCPVSMYIGGAEHSVLHLLYVRFVAMVLHDLKSQLQLPFEEPFPRFFAHGLIVKDGAKMSKSKGNIVVPDIYISKYGADSLRMYLMFLGPFEEGGDFRDTGIEGMYKFVRRVWTFLSQVSVGGEEEDSKRAISRTVKKVTDDMEKLSYNTAIARLMEFYNFAKDKKQLSKETITAYLKLLSPFLPHMTEELFKKLALGEGSIHKSIWPSYEEKYLEEKEIVIPVQVNGKKRGEIKIESSKASSQEAIEEAAKNAVRKYIENGVKKTIYVPGKIINFVT